MSIEFTAQPQKNKEKEKSKMLSKFLNRIDFDSLRQIISEYVQASGLTLGQTLFIEKENIVDSQKSRVGYNDGSNIGLNMVLATQNAINGLTSRDLGVLLTLCHEEVHAISKDTHYKEDDENYIFVSGYSFNTVDDYKIGAHPFFRLFDEGVTEILGREITRRYLDSHPDFVGKYNRIRFETDSVKNPLMNSYQQPVDFVNAFIIRLSKELELEEKTVWQAIIRSKIEGFIFFEKEVEEMFEEMFSKGFVSKLGNAQNVQAIRDLTSFIENSPLMPKVCKLEKLKRKIQDLLLISKEF